MKLLLCFLLVFLVFSDDIVVGLDIGAENSHAVILGGQFLFHVLHTPSGKQSIPSIVTINNNRRYSGEEAFQKVYLFSFAHFFITTSCLISLCIL